MTNQAKRNIAAIIVNHIKTLNPPGRFLIDNKKGEWEEISEPKAVVKTCQALREHQSAIRKGSHRDGIKSLCIFTEDETEFILETFRIKR